MRVLYFCVENACRSQMAEALTNMLGTEGVEAYSAGADPAASIDRRAIDVMREVGCDLSGHTPKSLDELPEIEFDYAITLGYGGECPMVKARMHIDWDVPDPQGLSTRELRAIRDSLRERIQRLLVAPRRVAD